MEYHKAEWKEWTSLRTLTDQIPQQFQHGLSISPLSLTCIDGYLDHLILGTNAGLVYLVHLPSYNIIKLICENGFVPICCVAAVSSMDDMISVGDSKGNIIIFQIPTSPTESNLTASHGNTLKNQQGSKSSKRFILNLHKTSVTSLVWSRSCTKLFSGDSEGKICLVEVDYEKSECTGRSLLQVDSRVVQLSYSHQILAISYKERCMLYNLKDGCKKFVGSKPRQPPGNFGCTFGPSSEDSQDNVVYCARPGQKIWVSNTEGTVLYSYIQQKLPEHSQIQLIGIPKNYYRNIKCSFGLLHHYKESILISYSERYFIILNVKDQKVLGYSCAFHKICDIAVVGDHIFVLENNRNIICISSTPPCFSINVPINSLVNSVHLPLRENINLGALNDIKSKFTLPNKEILSNIAKIGETVASKISEIAAPAIVPGNKEDKFTNNNSPKKESENDKLKSEEFRPKPFLLGAAGSAAIQAMQHHSYVFKPDLENTSGLEDSSGGSSHSSTPNHGASPKDTIEGKGNKTDEVVFQIRSKKKVRKKRDIKNEQKESDRYEFEGKPMSLKTDSRTYEDFKVKIEENESLLADVLNLTCLKMDHEKSNNDLLSLDKREEEREFICSVDDGQNYRRSESLSKSTGSLQCLESGSYNTLVLLDNEYGPPSGSSVFHSSLDNANNQPIGNSDGGRVTGKLSETSLLIEEYGSIHVTTMPPPLEMPLGWRKNHLPSSPKTFIGYGNSICFTEFRDLYFSEDFFLTNEKLPSWNRKRLNVQILQFCSFDKDLVLQIKNGLIIKLDREKLLGSKVHHVCSILEDSKNIRCACYDQNHLWILYNTGKLTGRNLNHEEGERSTIRISCQELTLKTLVCRSGVVWGLTNKGRIAYRIGVRPSVPLGLEWGIMLHTDEVISIHLSGNGLGWMMDKTGNLFVALFVSQTYPQGVDGKWWQVGLSEYMFEESLSMIQDEVEPRVMMMSNDHFLWVAQSGSPYAFTHSIKSFVGHRWELLGDENFSEVCAGGVFKCYGILYCLDASGDLFAVSSYSDRVVPIDLPKREKLVSISSRPESLWVLTTSGKIFIRAGLSGKAVLGLKWVRLNLQQIDDVTLKHLSLSTEVVWAVDSNGLVYMRQGPLTPPDPKKKGLDPAWLQVDSKELKNEAVFEKVYVGNKNHIVWGIDSQNRVYVREAIYPEFPTGTSWVLVPGLLAIALSISEDRVFALAPACGCKSKVFERVGITSTNYIGDSWNRIPTGALNLKHVSASVDNCVWGIDESGKIYKHSSLSLFDVNLDGKVPSGGHEERYSSSDLEDWEVV